MTTEPKAKGVDVLAVMNREIDGAGGKAYPGGRELIATRDAVAELIDASNVVVVAYRDGWLDDDVISRLADVLKRIGSEG